MCNAIESIVPQQLFDDRIACADGVCQTGEDVVSIDRKAAGVSLSRCVANCRGNWRVVEENRIGKRALEPRQSIVQRQFEHGSKPPA
jgi:hypothetical protein